MSIRRRSSSAVTISGTVDVDLDHTTDSFTLGDETNKLSLIDSGGVKTIPVKIYGAIAGGAAMVDDAAFSIGVDTVNPLGAVYKSSVDTIDDGDVGAVHMTSTRAMHVYIKGSDLGAGSGTASTDSAAYTPATSVFTPCGGAYDDVATDSLAEGEMGIVRLTATRKMHTYDSAAEALLTTQAGYLDGIEGLLTTQAGYLDGIETLITSTNTKLDTLAGYLDGVEGILTTIDADTGSMLTSLQLIDDCVFVDDAAFTPATSKVLAIGATFDDAATDSVDEGDIGALRMTSTRHLMVAVQSAPTTAVTGTFWQATQPISGTVTINAIPAGTNNIGDVDVLSLPAIPAGTNNIGDVDILTIAAGDNNIGNVDIVTMPAVAGAAAHDAAISGNPVRGAGRAMLANGTAVAEDDTCDIATDNQGRTVVTPHVPRDLVVQGFVTQSNTTEATLLAAGAAGVFHDVTKLIMSNSNTTTAVRVQIRDATAGTIRLEVVLPAMGGAVIDFGTVPMTQTTAANNWTIDQAATVADTYCFIQAIKRIA